MNNGGGRIATDAPRLPPRTVHNYACAVSGFTFFGAPRLITSPAAIFAARSANFLWRAESPDAGRPLPIEPPAAARAALAAKRA